MTSCAMTVHENAAAFDALAGLLRYPRSDYTREIELAKEALGEFCPAAAQKLEDFLRQIRALDPAELEERYVSAFELDPSGSLYTGIHLFGEESFKRGAFMAELNGRCREVGVEAGSEPPDHVSVVLRYYARASAADREELARYALLGTLEKMAASTGPAAIFAPLLQAALFMVKMEFPDLVPEPFPIAAKIACGARGDSTAAGGCGSGCGMTGAGMGDRDFLTSEEKPL